MSGAVDKGTPGEGRDPVSGIAPANDSQAGKREGAREVVRRFEERPSITPHESWLGDVRIAVRRRRFIRTYFTQLDAEYEALCPSEYKQLVRGQVEQLRARHALCPSWELNHRYEYVVMAGLPPAILRLRLQIYRERLLTLAGPERSRFLQGVFLESAPDDVDAQRLAGLGMLAEIQRLRHVRSEFELLRNRLLVSFLIVGGIFGLLFFYLWTAQQPVLPPPVHVVSGGLLGAYFSVLLRLGALRFRADYNANYQQVDRLFWNMISTFALAMFEGAVAAFVLHTIFIAGAIQGAFFPTFTPAPISGSNLAQLLHVAPVDTVESAKLILWCVLAGFSERLIPDILSSLTQDAERRAGELAKGGSS